VTVTAIPLPDSVARERIRTDLDRTFFVEAGAGTGKTRMIVERIVELVAAGKATAASLVAITFTEAAAGELRSRIREALEQAAEGRERTEEERERLRAAAGNLDAAAISTIHAFASELLRSYPFDANCPPRLEVVDGTMETLELNERFRDWFEQAGEDLDLAPAKALERAFALGLTPTHLQNLMIKLSREGDLLKRDMQWKADPRPIGLSSAVAQWGQTIEELGEPDGLPDHGFTRALAAARLLRDRALGAKTDTDCLAALLLAARMGQVHGDLGSFKRLRGDVALGRNIKETLQEVAREAKGFLALERSDILRTLLPHVVEWVLSGADQRRHAGKATFQDLLAWSRDLLQNEDVRRVCRSRWTHIIVDEFQDTDPLQAEIVMMLSATEDWSPQITSWRYAPLIPGRLMVVGDPKQSIYRFRRADIAIYEAVGRAVVNSGGEILRLSTNFRCRPEIVDLVNCYGRREIQEDPGIQPAYVDLHVGVEGNGPCVSWMGSRLDGNADAVWTVEATQVAEAAKFALAQQWTVRDPETGDLRSARAEDICVLIPSRTNVRRLEQAFDAFDVPYRLESGALILRTQEVRDLLSILRAIDDPSDQVALVAALRSPAYGCSDLELYRWVGNGGGLNYMNPSDGGVTRVSEAMHDLARRNSRRHDVSVPSLVDDLIGSRAMALAAFGEPRYREVLRRLRWVSDTVRQLATAGSTGLRETIDLLDTMSQDVSPVDTGASTETDEDTVRVLTVHGAKGLEFPIVILTGLGSDPRFVVSDVLVDRLSGEIDVRVRADSGDIDFKTANYEQGKGIEKDFAEAERKRLLYVASTRARDHLIVSVSRGRQGADALKWEEVIQEVFDPKLARERRLTFAKTHEAARWPSSRRAEPEAVADYTRLEDGWIGRRSAGLTAGAEERILTPSALAHQEVDEDAEPDTGDVMSGRQGRGGTALGRAVHGVMKDCSLSDVAGLAALARAQAAIEGITYREPRVIELSKWLWDSEPVRRAVASGRWWREVPVGASLDAVVYAGSVLDEVLVEGFIDLLYEDGADLVVVDYKTDDVRDDAEIEARMAKYRIQGEAYARLVHEVTGRRVARCEFVFPVATSVYGFEPH
jgi:ATP-dependent helicase/nuclease subunit A